MRYVFILGLISALFYFSCEKIEFFEGNNFQYEFSLDTLTFDTVFTERGSATRHLKIRNLEDKFIRLESIKIRNFEDFFLLNVNGESGKEIKNIEIPPHDSIYIFVEAIIDPDNDVSASPFIIESDLVVTNGDSEKTALIMAWGQNANYFPNRMHGRRVSAIDCEGGRIVFDDDKPFIFYGSVILNNCQLELTEGTRLFFHGGLGFFEDGNAYYDGQLIVPFNSRILINGTAENPVIIHSDRPENKYRGVPGQYLGLQIYPGSRGNRIKHARISEGIFGVSIDSLSEVTIENTEIKSTASSGVYSRHGNITMKNTLVEGSGGSNVALQFGGKHQIEYCTFSNFQNTDSERALGFNDFFVYEDQQGNQYVKHNPIQLTVKNSIMASDYKHAIVYGELNDSAGFEDLPDLNFTLQNSIIKLDNEFHENNPGFAQNCVDCFYDFHVDSLFIDRREGDYHLDTMSQAVGKAMPIPGILEDIEAFSRSSIAPDIGAYESRIKN